MNIVDRDGNPVEIPREQAGEVRTFPEPESVPERIVITGSHMSSASYRQFHRPDPDDPGQPACEVASKFPRASWKNQSSHAVPGNFPACPRCFPEVEDE